jgi:PAS domain S-box-containing protein
MAPTTWERASTLLSSAGGGFADLGSNARHWASIGSEQVTSMRAARIEPWRLVFAFTVIVIPAFLLSLVTPRLGATVPVIFFLAAVALATYVADWVGGLTATITGTLGLDLLFIEERWRFDAWDVPRQVWVLLSFVLGAAVFVSLFEHLKYDRASARLESAAMRAANTAFNAVEIAAASRPAGDSEAFIAVLQSILTAMVRVNRASAGALYLVDSPNASLIQAATYGGTEDDSLSPADDPSRTIPVDFGFAGRVAQERRAITIADIGDDAEFDDVRSTNPHVRAVVGVPIFGPTDALAGVAWVGLYVPYRFSPTAIARLQALAHRTVAFMESARLADAQEELLDRVQDNHRRLQSVIQTMPEAVMVARPPNGVIVTFNAAAQRMFGLQTHPSQLMTRRVDQLPIRSEPPEAVPTMPMIQSMTDGITVTGTELVVRGPGGQMIPVVASAAPLRNDDGDVDAVVGVFQDVAPLKEAERLRDEFISVVSHELRSPLTPIRGFAQIIGRDLEKEGGHDQHVAWLNTLQQHTDRLTRLVDDLLDVSRMRAGRLRVLREEVDVVELCRSLVESKRASQTTHKVVLDTELTSLVARMDGDRVHQIIDNLVSNAIKYTDGGTITVGLDDVKEAGDIRITVSDEGRGIPPRERESLFTAFYRARSANESAVPGLGLGLYIVRELVRAHDGSIAIDEAPGGGARFIVELPRRAPAA